MRSSESHMKEEPHVNREEWKALNRLILHNFEKARTEGCAAGRMFPAAGKCTAEEPEHSFPPRPGSWCSLAVKAWIEGR